MIIFINGEEQKTEKTKLFDILEEFGFQQNWVATAVNQNVVSADQRKDFVVHPNDKIEILSPMQGG